MAGIIKAVGACIVIGTALYFGMSLIAQLRRRAAVLSELLSSFVRLNNEISYGHAPLDDAFYALSGGSGDVAAFYGACHEDMSKLPKISFEELWQKNTEKLFSPSIFARTEKDVMYTLGETLGGGDTQTQVRGILHASESLKAIKEEADRERTKKPRLYLGLCACISAMIIIIAL